MKESIAISLIWPGICPGVRNRFSPSFLVVPSFLLGGFSRVCCRAVVPTDRGLVITTVQGRHEVWIRNPQSLKSSPAPLCRSAETGPSALLPTTFVLCISVQLHAIRILSLPVSAVFPQTVSIRRAPSSELLSASFASIRQFRRVAFRHHFLASSFHHRYWPFFFLFSDNNNFGPNNKQVSSIIQLECSFPFLPCFPGDVLSGSSQRRHRSGPL